MTVPEAVHVDTDTGPIIHVMTDGVLVAMPIMDAQLFQVRLGKAIDSALAADRPSDAPERPMTAKQNRYVHALLGNQGITGDARHAVLSRILGRPIGSASELDVDDASTVIEALQTSEDRRRAAARAADHEEAF